MIDMKVSEADKKESAQEMESELNAPNYPYGLRIYIDDDSYKKLGLKDCQVGEKLSLSAICEVMSVSAENVKGDEKEISISLQLKEMELVQNNKSDADVIYGE